MVASPSVGSPKHALSMGGAISDGVCAHQSKAFLHQTMSNAQVAVASALVGAIRVVPKGPQRSAHRT